MGTRDRKGRVDRGTMGGPSKVPNLRLDKEASSNPAEITVSRLYCRYSMNVMRCLVAMLMLLYISGRPSVVPAVVMYSQAKAVK
jgi:hypothetical protein